MPTDPDSAVARRFVPQAHLHDPYGQGPDPLSLEGYIAGRLVIEVLRGVPAARVTRAAVLDQVYNTRLFVVDDLTLGAFNREYRGCDAIVCGCNAGLRSVFMSVLDPATGAHVADAALPRLRFPPTACAAPATRIRRPVLFGQLVPQDGIWRGLADEIAAGAAAAFAAANAAGGLGGRPFELVRRARDGAGDAAAALAERYPLAGLLGSVGGPPAPPGLPAIGAFDPSAYAPTPAFRAEDLRVQPSTELELMALVAFAVARALRPIRFRAPATAAGRAALALLLRAIRTLQEDPDSAETYGAADGAAVLDGLDGGCVIALGSAADLRRWFRALEGAPALRLLTTAPAALALMAGLAPSPPAHAARLHFPFAAVGARDATLAWQYGYVAASAVVQALTRSTYATRPYTTAEHVVGAWYEVTVMRAGNVTLGPYFRSACRFAGDTHCRCNAGLRSLAVFDATGARGPYTYDSGHCGVVYRPKEDALPVVLAAALAGAAALALLGAGLRVALRRGRRDNSAAPRDARRPFCVLFTDIQSSTHLWATVPEAMAEALDRHHALIRQLIAKHKCYEVKTIGDSFMCAAHTPEQALAFSVDLQRQFYASIDDVYREKELEDSDDARPYWPDPLPLEAYRRQWNGLRVRVGVHYGAGDIKLDPVSRGYDYYGTVVNTAARVESVCHGGQIGATKAVYDALRGRAPDVEWTDLGPQPLRGLAEPVHIVQALPCGALAARAFPPLRLDRERAGDAAEESAASRAGSAGSGASRGTAADAVFVPEQHPLVHKGQVSAAELRLHYNVSLTTLSTLLQTQTRKFKEATLKGLCDRLKVRHAGSAGPGLHKTLHGLVLRVLPATVVQQREKRGSVWSMASASSGGSGGLRAAPSPKSKGPAQKRKAGQVAPVEIYVPAECDV